MTAKSVTRVPPSKGWAFLSRAERNVQCQDQKSSGAACSAPSSECGKTPSGTSRAHQVARDHHALAVEAVEKDAGQRTGQDGRDGARQHHAGDHHAIVGLGQDKAENGDVVEVIADLAHHLADPRIAVIVVAAEK